MERAGEAGIPVAIFDSAIDTTRVISCVATGNTEAGRMAARRMGEIIGGKGKVGIVGFMPGSASTMERETGFQDEIRKLHPAIEIVGIQFGMASRAKAMALTENFLTAHSDLAGSSRTTNRAAPARSRASSRAAPARRNSSPSIPPASS
ncbi:MAG: substrate-binding domain-containing protein [Bryobacteraceae bacterium]